MTTSDNTPPRPAMPESWYEEHRAAVAFGIARGLIAYAAADEDTNHEENAPQSATSQRPSTFSQDAKPRRRDPFAHLRRKP